MDEHNALAIIERIKTIRRQLNFNQKEFATQLNISPASLSEIEAGKLNPRHDVLFTLFTKFRVNMFYLLLGKGAMFKPPTIEQDILEDADGELAEFLKDFLFYFKHSPILRYEMMRFFRTFMIENERTVQRDIQKTKENGVSL
jgi:transcriptional regulator with XRE-family HTH domain